MKFDIWVFFENLSGIFKFNQNLTWRTGTLHADLCTLMIKSRWVLLRMRHVSDKTCTENQNTHFMFNNFFPTVVPFIDNVKKCCTAGQATDDNIIRRMRFACWITKATDTHSEYAILFFFTPTWLGERASMLRLYVHCLFLLRNSSFCVMLNLFQLNSVFLLQLYVTGRHTDV